MRSYCPLQLCPLENWLRLRSRNVHDSATFETYFMFGLSGVVDVTLFFCTRTDLLSLRDPPGRRHRSRFGIAPGTLFNPGAPLNLVANRSEVSEMESGSSKTQQNVQEDEPIPLRPLPDTAGVTQKEDD